MGILDKIIELLTEQNRKQKELTDYLGIEKSIFSAWKIGDSVSYKKYLPEISNFFGVSVDYLLGRTTKDGNSMEPNKINNLKIRIDYGGLDEALEKVSRLNKLLKETIELINSLKM